jgi:type III secretory pathway component EscS
LAKKILRVAKLYFLYHRAAKLVRSASCLLVAVAAGLLVALSQAGSRALLFDGLQLQEQRLYFRLQVEEFNLLVGAVGAFCQVYFAGSTDGRSNGRTSDFGIASLGLRSGKSR